jgi:hypothetical protein
MAVAPKLPLDEASEALDILRRLEPVLRDIQAEQRRQGETVARLDGRVSQLPTLVQIVGAVLGINAGIIALGFGLARLIVR